MRKTEDGPELVGGGGVAGGDDHKSKSGDNRFDGRACDAQQPESGDNRFDGRAHNVVQAGHVDVVNVYTGPADRPPPNSLPSVASRFHDREPQLRRITETVNVERPEDGPAVFVVAGLRGVGKTAMAVHWAGRERERFPDGLLYRDLGGGLSQRGMGGGLGDTLADLLGQLGIEGEHLPSSDEGRLSLLRTRLSGRKVFLLLDNARLASEVERLLPPSPHSVVFVTTGSDLTEVEGLAGRHDAEVILLRELSDEVSLRLLRALIGSDRVDRDIDGACALLRVCGGWPLAIRLAAGRLKARPNLRLADLATRLEEAHRGSRLVPEGEWVVRVVGDESYEAMPPDVRRAYRLLSLHPTGGDRPTEGGRGPAVAFRRGAAAALLDRTEAETAVLLDALIDRHLLDEDDDRYTFHDLIRVHARSRAEREEDESGRDAALRRVADWYLRSTIEADLAVNPHRPTSGPVYRELRGRESPYGSGPEAVKRALDWLRAEHHNLCALVYAAGDRGWHPLAWQLCEALWGFYLSLKHYDQWIATHRIGLRAAEELGDPEARFRVGIQLGRALYETRRFAEAHEVLRKTLDVVPESEKPLDRATTLEFIGRAHFDAGEPDQALSYFQESKDLEETHDRPRGVAIKLHHLARAHLDLGDEDEAMRALERAREIFAGIPDAYNQGRVLLTLGRSHLKAGRVEPAEAALNEALGIMRVQERTYQIGEVAQSLAELAELTGDHSRARELRNAAIAAYDQVGSLKAAELRAEESP